MNAAVYTYHYIHTLPIYAALDSSIEMVSR
jgi:hypothetical protein